MKLFKCPNCQRERKKQNNMPMVLCRCGHYMKQIKYKMLKGTQTPFGLEFVEEGN